MLTKDIVGIGHQETDGDMLYMDKIAYRKDDLVGSCYQDIDEHDAINNLETNSI